VSRQILREEIEPSAPARLGQHSKARLSVGVFLDPRRIIDLKPGDLFTRLPVEIFLKRWGKKSSVELELFTGHGPPPELFETVQVVQAAILPPGCIRIRRRRGGQ